MKTMLTKSVCLSAVVGVALLTVAGCGGSKSEPNSAGKSSNTAEQGGQTEQAAKIKIKLWEKPQPDAPKGKVEAYNAMMAKVKQKFPNIEIQDETLKPGTDYRQEYDKALMANEAPTGWRELPNVDIPTRIKNGTIADISEFYSSWEYKDQMIDTFNESISTADGKWYAVPVFSGFINTLYNAKTIQAGGGDPEKLPETWAEFAEMGQKITDVGVPRFGYEIVGMDWNAWPFTAWVWSAGGEMVRPNDDGTYKIAFNEEAGVDAAVFWNEMVWKHQMTQKDTLQDWNKLQDDIMAGRAAFSWFDVSGLDQTALDKYGQQMSDFGIMPMPVKDKSITRPSLAGGRVITINPKASKEEQKAAFDVLTYITYDEELLKEQWEIAARENISDLNVPARKDLYKLKLSLSTTVPERIKQELVAAAAGAKSEPFCPNWNDLKNALSKPLQQILLKKDISRDEVKSLLDKTADELYAKYPDSFRK
ncbi:ABC transporter substrate-binding protein [Cohnella phaseoli]|uniref:ABC-type glycerol-3-phosphate transport system substrate-binding protein n=1 Tax=Cohnella phaseoli TaxID=456490 RepID=A0A3D9IUQ9_9BACL|nr:extracellular solute-binding protein [Cohnella phaseoli]RED65508.1 ABC-type glycerol-3-phosphate transport system substrate-binding protein [Cohnella phaseoli]